MRPRTGTQLSWSRAVPCFLTPSWEPRSNPVGYLWMDRAGPPLGRPSVGCANKPVFPLEQVMLGKRSTRELGWALEPRRTKTLNSPRYVKTWPEDTTLRSDVKELFCIPKPAPTWKLGPAKFPSLSHVSLSLSLSSFQWVMLVNIFAPRYILSSFQRRDRLVFALGLSYFLMHGSCVETVLVKAKT